MRTWPRPHDHKYHIESTAAAAAAAAQAQVINNKIIVLHHTERVVARGIFDDRARTRL